MFAGRKPVGCGLLLLGASASCFAQPGMFTVEVAVPPPLPMALVRFDQTWRYYKGLEAPQPDWKTIADADLGSTWAAGPGGFGFGDNDDSTVLTDMFNGYSTVYIRQSFVTGSGIDTDGHLHLVMDYDDAFIAWLDGVEIARSANAPGAPGTEPPHTAIANPPNHEASGGTAGNPPEVYDLGPAGNRLAPGTHILAVMGLNGARNSSDFSLIAGLRLMGSARRITPERFFTVVNTNGVILSGSNTLANSTRVTVNGVPANFDLAQGTWSHAQRLEPNLNRFFVAALDARGRILASVNKDIVAELDSLSVGGTIASDTSLSVSNLTVRLTNDLIIARGAKLVLGENTVVLVASNFSIRVQAEGALEASGTPHQPVYFLPAGGADAWGELSASGPGASLTLRQAEVVGGQLGAFDGGRVLVEDSAVRDLDSPGRDIITGRHGGDLTVRRSSVARFGKIVARETPVRIEDCLLEHATVAVLDLASTNAPVVVRRCTLRHGNGTNDSNAVQLGPGAAPLVEHCLIHDFGGQGISIGPNAAGTIVRQSLIYRCRIGVAAYASSNCVVAQSTISGCRTGLFLSGDPGAARVTGTNNIVWGNAIPLAALETSLLDLAYSDVEGGIVPGEGNISSDPRFRDVTAGDFRLGDGSPALGAGMGGADMGVLFSVGGIPPGPFNLEAVVDGTNAIQLSWEDAADNEETFRIERSDNGADWEPLTVTLPGQTGFTDESAALGQFYFYRVRAENLSGVSRWSNVAGGIREIPTVHVGGVLARDTVWSPALGAIVVTSTVIVPADVTLTLQAGTLVRITNNAGIRATDGGTIVIAGAEDQKVVLAPLNTGAPWQELGASNANSSLTVRHADISGGRTAVRDGAAGLFEDSYFHDFRLSSCAIFECPILVSSFASSMVVRRCHFSEYHETLFRDGVMVIEDSLFEYISGDGLDFDGAQPGTVVRRCTFRHGTRAPANIDAVDLGPSQVGPCRNVLIEDCLMFDFPTDKGVSIGDAPNRAVGTVVRNCLIYGCLSGVQVKDDCVAEVYRCTIVDNGWGLTNYNKINPTAPSGGGHTTNAHNNILWDNGITISMRNSGTLTADHCNFGNTNWPGAGNLNVDPLFVNAALRDYRLAPGSPCRGTGRDGDDMGAAFPVGAPMASSHPGFQSVHVSNGEVVLRFWADSEKTYTLESSSTASGGPWTRVADVTSPPVPKLVEIRQPIAPGDIRFYRIVTPQQPEP